MIKFSFKTIFLFGLVVMFTIVGLFSTIYFGPYIFTGGSPIIENIKLVSKLILLLTGLLLIGFFLNWIKILLMIVFVLL